MRFPVSRQIFHTSAVATTVALSWLAVTSLSCNESLPPYETPNSLFVGSLQPTTVYSARSGPVVKIYFSVTSVFTQTLQSHGKLTGTLSIVLTNDTSYHKTFALDSSYFVSAQSLDPRTGLVTIDPGSSLLFLAMWDLIDDYGRYIPGNAFPVTFNPACPTLQQADPQLFNIRCSFQVFDHIGQVVVQPIQFEFDFRAGDPC